MKIEKIKSIDDILNNIYYISNDDLVILLIFFIRRQEVIATALDRVASDAAMNGIFQNSLDMFSTMEIPLDSDKCDKLVDQISVISNITEKIIEELYNRRMKSILLDGEDVKTRASVVNGLANLATEKYLRTMSGLSLQWNIRRIKVERKEIEEENNKP